MCDYCKNYCQICFEDVFSVLCEICDTSICRDCIIPTNIYNDKIAKYVFGNSDSDSEDKPCKKYRKPIWPDIGYICNDCYKLKRAENMVRIMNGLFRHFIQKNQLHKP
jgi:hypothetical protein